MEQQQPNSIEKAQNQVLYAGFDKQYHDQIKNIAAQPDGKYLITHKEDVEKANAQHDLELNVKGGQIYYNGMRSTLTDKDSGQAVSQWFPADMRITKTEAVQLLWDTEIPRAVHKTYHHFNDQAPTDAKPEEKVTKEPLWLQLDFKHSTKHGNFRVMEYKDYDLAEKLRDFQFSHQLRYPSEMGKAIGILQKGGEYEVAATADQPKVYISANPSRGTIHIRDEEGNLLKHDQFRTDQAREAAAEKKKQHVDNPGQTPTRRYNKREMSPGNGTSKKP